MESAKRSKVVALTLVGLPVGAIALANAFPAQEMRRNLYPDRAACERDYSAKECEPNTTSGSSSSTSRGGGGGFYHGPYYAASRGAATAASDPGPGRTGQITRTETSTRGGFGAFGHAMRAVG